MIKILVSSETFSVFSFLLLSIPWSKSRQETALESFQLNSCVKISRIHMQLIMDTGRKQPRWCQTLVYKRWYWLGETKQFNICDSLHDLHLSVSNVLWSCPLSTSSFRSFLVFISLYYVHTCNSLTSLNGACSVRHLACFNWWSWFTILSTISETPNFIYIS